MCDDDPFGSYGLGVIALDDKPLFDSYLESVPGRPSDYTFANAFMWRNPVRSCWGILHDALCLFANGDGGLTLLMPPIAPPGSAGFGRAVEASLEICETYNRDHGVVELPRIEYVSSDLLACFPGDFAAEPMSGDYVYLTRRLIDLDGGDLKSKRRLAGRYVRDHDARTEVFGPEHVQPCLDVLERWYVQHEDVSACSGRAVSMKRGKDLEATGEAIRHAAALKLAGMVLYDGDALVGFTFGELLDAQTSCIVIEKTDRACVGSAQYIFAEFCRQFWAQTPFCNVGDDWDVPSLAFTKESYRPVSRVAKWCVRPARAVQVAGISLPVLSANQIANEVPAPLPGEPETDRACEQDLPALVALENSTFDPAISLGKRQIRGMLRNPRASVHVLRDGGQLQAAAIVLRRKTVCGVIGRIYSLAVDESCRGKGVGKQLLTVCLDALRAEQIETCVLEVASDNTPAIRLYEKFGFRITALLRDYHGPGRDAWKMRAALKPTVAEPELPFAQATEEAAQTARA